jgi:hypothetical protein
VKHHFVADSNKEVTGATPPLFPLGRLLATPGALNVIRRAEASAFALLHRHQRGDWGDLCPDDVQANWTAIGTGLRILSSYSVGGAKLWIITEADRSATTILLPDEY